MSDNSHIVWENKLIGRPRIEGSLEISKDRTGIFIGGDPCALRSFAKLLVWMANINQESLVTQPDGERCHVHLHARDAEGFNSLTPFSSETEICRLDAKGTGEFPKQYQKLGKDIKGEKKGGRNGKAKKSQVPKRKIKEGNKVSGTIIDKQMKKRFKLDPAFRPRGRHSKESQNIGSLRHEDLP
jgi:hypothetical protein